MKKLTTAQLSVQLSIVIIGGLLLISGFSIYTIYTKHIESAQKGVLEKLHSISATLSNVIDGDEQEQIITKYTKKDEIKESEQDTLYYETHKLLRATQLGSNIPTDIYTLFFDEERTKLCFGVASGESPYFRHMYDSYPPEIKDNYDKGGSIGPFKDEHGVWLSSFSPIKNSSGATVGIIMVDRQFDEFISEARSELWFNIILSLVVFGVISGFVLFTVRKLAKIDAEKTNQLSDAFAQLKVKNKDITDSINYARRIQQALIPHKADVEPHLPQSFMFYEPKDVVSGDFPWFYKRDHYLYFSAVDCTGHGVPGAMMSIIGALLLNDIVNDAKVVEPGEMLDRLHDAVVNTLKQHEYEPGQLSDGMDVAMCRIDLDNNEVHFAGAHRPLYHIQDGELIQYKGNRSPIGGAQYRKGPKAKVWTGFDNQVVKIKKGDTIFFFSDGLPDQFGGSGESEEKFGQKRIRDIILNAKDFSQIKPTMEQAYFDWKGDTKQIDDILLIGVKF